jgi:hypothetical protein
MTEGGGEGRGGGSLFKVRLAKVGSLKVSLYCLRLASAELLKFLATIFL